MMSHKNLSVVHCPSVPLLLAALDEVYREAVALIILGRLPRDELQENHPKAVDVALLCEAASLYVRGIDVRSSCPLTHTTWHTH